MYSLEKVMKKVQEENEFDVTPLLIERATRKGQSSLTTREFQSKKFSQQQILEGGESEQLPQKTGPCGEVTDLNAGP